MTNCITNLRNLISLNVSKTYTIILSKISSHFSIINNFILPIRYSDIINKLGKTIKSNMKFDIHIYNVVRTRGK